MINNEGQYRITKAKANRFEAALSQIDEQNSHLQPRFRQAMRDGMESELSILREQLAAYEALGLKIREQTELPPRPREELA